MIDQLIQDLKRDEGFVEHVYPDHLGYLTLGYGFMVDERRGGGIPEPVAQYWLEYEIEKRFDSLLEKLPWLVDQPEDVQRALGNMSYQLGVNGLLNFRNMLAALESGDRETAASEALNSRWAQQTPHRAKRVAALIWPNTPNH